MDAAAVAAGASGAIAILALGLGLVRYGERRRQQLLAGLQAGDGAAAAVATRVRHGRLPRSNRNRGELLEAMCLAAVFGRSGPSTSLIYAALAKSMVTEKYRRQIISSVADIQEVISRNSPYTDLASARRRLFALRAAVGIDDDVRMRVERAGSPPRHADDTAAPDERCTDETHTWGSLKEVLRQRESVVLVCPMPRPGGLPGCAALALDFHKTARLPERVPGAVPRGRPHAAPAPADETFELTELGQRVHRAKYLGSVADLKLIASELADIIASHSRYNKAEMIAVVSGRNHDFSVELGKEVAALTAKPCVAFPRRSRSGAGPAFALTEPDSVKDKDIILIDDVYRTGGTLREAARALAGAGARHVLGLTATCAVSAMGPPRSGH